MNWAKWNKIFMKMIWKQLAECINLPTEKLYSLGRHKMFKCWKWSSSDPMLVGFIIFLQLRSLLPHEAMWEREATCWRGPGRQRTTLGNMAETGQQQNGGQDLHVGLAGMLVTSYLFQKSHNIFFPCLFLLWCRTPQVPLCSWSMGHYATDMWVWGWRGSFSR